jgi:hypothetical protein
MSCYIYEDFLMGYTRCIDLHTEVKSNQQASCGRCQLIILPVQPQSGVDTVKLSGWPVLSQSCSEASAVGQSRRRFHRREAQSGGLFAQSRDVPLASALCIVRSTQVAKRDRVSPAQASRLCGCCVAQHLDQGRQGSISDIPPPGPMLERLRAHVERHLSAEVLRQHKGVAGPEANHHA